MSRIEDYALIGDLQTAALIGRDGSVDWCCFPRFDSDACFAALLGGPDNGYWSLAPTVDVRRRTRRYRHDMLILELVIETDRGTIRTIDFMPPRTRTPDIVRIVEGLDGEVPMRSELVIRFDYGKIVPWVRRIDHARLAIAGPDALCFRTPVQVHGENLSTVAEFVVRQGERIPFTLTWFPSHLRQPPRPIDAEGALGQTEGFWLDWASSCGHRGAYHEEIHQSLRILKALTYAPTGGIVAAPTTSLPEVLGGPRNWDYRFCWLRDATLTLGAMLKCGYRDEARAWRAWLVRAVAGDPADLQIMYGLAGERRLDERELEWLDGYEGSRPVRVGNAASTQLQLDVYGEVLDAMYLTRLHGVEADDDSWSLLVKLLGWLEGGWRRPDAGVWEVRVPAQHFTHSKVMAWVAFDRGIRFHEEFGRDAPTERWRRLRDEIHAQVLDRGWSDERQAFTQSYGSVELDASLLVMPLVGFLPAGDPRVVATVEAILCADHLELLDAEGPRAPLFKTRSSAWASPRAALRSSTNWCSSISAGGSTPERTGSTRERRPPSKDRSRHPATDVSDTPERLAASATDTSPRNTAITTRSFSSGGLTGGRPITPPIRRRQPTRTLRACRRRPASSLRER